MNKPPRSPSDLGQNIMHPMYHTTRRLLAPKTFPDPRPREHVNSLDVPTFPLEDCELGQAFLQSHRISTPTTNVPTSAIHIGTPPIATKRPRLASNTPKRLSVRLCTISEHNTTTRYVGMTTKMMNYLCLGQTLLAKWKWIHYWPYQAYSTNDLKRTHLPSP